MMSSTFVGAKNLFDQEYGTTLVLPHSLVPVDGKHLANISLKNTAGDDLTPKLVSLANRVQLPLQHTPLAICLSTSCGV